MIQVWKPKARWAALVLSCGSIIGGCGTHGDDPSRADAAAPVSPSSSNAGSASSEDCLRRIEAAELTRVVAAIDADDQASRDPAVRRAAARALARIASPSARPGLLRALSDEDSDVIAWAAYGLGAICEVSRDETVSTLAARAVDLPEVASKSDADRPSLDAFATIARAIGRCNAPSSEPTLAAWLSAGRQRAGAASLALGDLASAQKRLREETIATLLSLAAGSASSPAVPEALFPIARVDNVPPSVVSRLLDVASARLAEKSDYRLFAVRALSRAKDGALPHLERVLLGARAFTGPERVEAARALAKLGADGDLTLSGALRKLAPDAKTIALGGAGFEVPLTIVTNLKSAKDSKDTLTQLASLTATDVVSAPGKRRLSTFRCAAARSLADANFKDPLLLACDLDSGAIGARAVLAVVAKGAFEGPRLEAFRKLLANEDVRTREAALELLGAHPEVVGSEKILTAALGAKESGIVATAAEQIAKSPILASAKAVVKPKQKPKTGGKPGNAKPAKPDAQPDAQPDAKPDEAPTMVEPPSAEVVAALRTALARAQKEQDMELIGSVVDAIGALALKELAPSLEELCTSTYPVPRDHASAALGLLTGKKRTCPAPEAAGPPPPELALIAGSTRLLPQTTLVLDTDAGELRIVLDASLAPVAVARFVDLAKSGYYDNQLVHRVDPSFVVQLGSPHGDGFGGPEGRMPLRCETSPLPFETLSVGVALAGRDSGSSQLFVMRARHPHLDGAYAIVGKASGPWDLVSEGDAIHSVRVE